MQKRRSAGLCGETLRGSDREDGVSGEPRARASASERGAACRRTQTAHLALDSVTDRADSNAKQALQLRTPLIRGPESAVRAPSIFAVLPRQGRRAAGAVRQPAGVPRLRRQREAPEQARAGPVGNEFRGTPKRRVRAECASPARRASPCAWPTRRFGERDAGQVPWTAPAMRQRPGSASVLLPPRSVAAPRQPPPLPGSPRISRSSRAAAGRRCPLRADGGGDKTQALLARRGLGKAAFAEACPLASRPVSVPLEKNRSGAGRRRSSRTSATPAISRRTGDESDLAPIEASCA